MKMLELNQTEQSWFFGAVRQTQTAEWQINEVNIVVECSNRFPIPKLDF